MIVNLLPSVLTMNDNQPCRLQTDYFHHKRTNVSWGARKIHIPPSREQQKDKTMLMQLVKGVKAILEFHDSLVWCDIFHLKEYCFQLGLTVKTGSPYLQK